MSAQLAENIDWVGYVDWNVRDFHSFDTFRGATYNSYLIRDTKTAVIDAVKAPYSSQLLQNIAEKTALEKIDYVVCNHAEPDHAGGLAALLTALPNAVLLCNKKCLESLAGYFDISRWKIQIITPDDKIPLGKFSLQFINTPMVHWPESMFTYIPEEQILFSMDAFGQHLATSERFDDQYDLSVIMQEAKAYYANIVTPYSKQVQRTLEAASSLPVRMIAPSHGLIWRKNIGRIVEAYKDWAGGKYVPKVLIVFDSMWDSTAALAQGVLDGAMSESDEVDVQLMHVRKTSMTRIAAEMLDAAAVALGSATLNMQMMPQMGGLLTYLSGLKFAPKKAAAFGSYGWAQAGVILLEKWIEETGWTKAADSVSSQFRPKPEDIEKAREAGKLLSRAALAGVVSK
ncbi:MAG: FprA family A-type flavoprotein [Planctomycetaceae bacterium]|jgi:flavorubredoxin|nr:FprA family A-type flavoprotein [Planctomycetaceae bacterium]